MALTYGFYNSRNGDRKYNAMTMSAIFDGIINDGVFQSIGTCFKPIPSTGLSVNVGIGRAWFDHTWTYNDSPMNLTFTQSDMINARIDAIVLEVNAEDSVRANSLKVIIGTPAASPQKPKLTNTATVNQYPIAYVTIPANATSIIDDNIEYVVGQSPCPFVTGILETVDVSDLITQWKSQFQTWMNEEKADFDAWYDTIKGILGEDEAGNLLNLIQQNTEAIETNTAAIETNTAAIETNTPVTKTITIASSAWSSGVYTLNDPLITATSIQEWCLPEFNGSNQAEIEALQKANIVGNGQSVGQAKIKCLGDVPTIKVHIVVIFWNHA